MPFGVRRPNLANSKECEKAGLDYKIVVSLERRFESLANEANKMGITIFCGSNNSLRFKDGGDGDLIVAHLNVMNCDGGAGDCCKDDDGYIRGESA